MTDKYPSISYVENPMCRLFLSIRDDLAEIDATKPNIPHVVIKVTGQEICVPLTKFKELVEKLYTAREVENV